MLTASQWNAVRSDLCPYWSSLISLERRWVFGATCDFTWLHTAAQWHWWSFQCQKRNKIIPNDFITPGSVCNLVSSHPTVPWWLVFHDFTALLYTLRKKDTIPKEIHILFHNESYKDSNNRELLMESMCVCVKNWNVPQLRIATCPRRQSGNPPAPHKDIIKHLCMFFIFN